ncbi:MAG TPA: hypothetical protein VN699_17135 [Pirellulales bacterium]|nr:hypothetical protein [Pirellulales bacterium]
MRSTSDGWPDDRLPQVPSSGDRWTRASESAERLHHAALAAAFLAAVGRLMFVQGAPLRVLWLFGMPPLFAYCVLRSQRSSPGARLLAWLFFALIAMGVLLAPMQRLLPWLNGFPQLPAAENRLLSWYLGVYLAYFLGILPPYISVRNLRQHARGQDVDFGPPTCWPMLFTWGLIVFGAGMALLNFLGIGPGGRGR